VISQFLTPFPLHSFGDNFGEQMINVTYIGDTLVATKVTGDENVPRGKVSFTCDLAPKNDSTALQPLRLSLSQSSSSSSTTKLPRYAGHGQVAKKGFVDHKFVDGQLVMFERHFSFVWIPTRHHVLFRRPSPEQTMTQMRDILSQEDEVENMRLHLERCYDMDMTESLARQQSDVSNEPFRRIATTKDLEALEAKLKDVQGNQIFKFWNAFKWTTAKHIDGEMG